MQFIPPGVDDVGVSSLNHHYVTRGDGLDIVARGERPVSPQYDNEFPLVVFIQRGR